MGLDCVSQNSGAKIALIVLSVCLIGGHAGVARGNRRVPRTPILREGFSDFSDRVHVVPPL